LAQDHHYIPYAIIINTVPLQRCRLCHRYCVLQAQIGTTIDLLPLDHARLLHELSSVPRDNIRVLLIAGELVLTGSASRDVKIWDGSCLRHPVPQWMSSTEALS
jgi:hypothetical protein